MFSTATVYQEEQRVVDDELSVESEQILGHGLEQSRDQNHSQIVSGHLVHLRVHLDPGRDGGGGWGCGYEFLQQKP